MTFGKIMNYKKLQEEIERGFRESQSLTDALSEESDRGFALITVSYLEKQLEKLLLKGFAPVGNPRKYLFGRFGFFPGLAAKTDGAYCLGLIDVHMRDELNLLRGIRNKFAHSFDRLSFSEGATGESVGKLKFLDYDLSTDPRTRFKGSIDTLMLLLSLEIKAANQPTLAKDFEPTPAKMKELSGNVEKVLVSVNRLLEEMFDVGNGLNEEKKETEQGAAGNPLPAE